ncbi:hypothetical protein GGI07_000122 [Coemansia sp. Benny D115]|nr:hypothetical protein GGI07_000122 [Coemansia sp. Benny D115]
MFLRNYPLHAYTEVNEMPPADWCMTTLQTLSNKYEHLAESRKVNPSFAEAVLNSFKSKLLNIVTTHSFYESEDNSESDTEWPLVGDGSAYDAAAASNSYLTISPSDIIEQPASDICYSPGKDAEDCSGVETNLITGLLSPSPSPTSSSDAVAEASSLYADGGVCDIDLGVSAADCVEAAAGISLSADNSVVFPPNIEEALRRFLANTSSQVLSDTFTTFADADSSIVTAIPAAVDDASDDQIFTGSGSCSPVSPESPEEPLEYLASADSVDVDVYVKSFVESGCWESKAPQQHPPEPLSDDDALLPCKRKRAANSEKLEEAEHNAAIARQTQLPRPKLLPLSPRKRSRSASHNDAASVPTTNAASSVEAPAALTSSEHATTAAVA